MNYPFKILFQSFVKPFYRENAGAFVLLFTMLFFIVGEVDGAGLFEYHYSLITGILKNGDFLLLVLFAWLLYARKYAAFVAGVLRDPHYAFFQVFNCLNKSKQFGLFVMAEVLLMMPVLLYAFLIVIVGCQQHFYLPVFYILGYLLLLCVGSALWHVYLLNNPDKNKALWWPHFKGWRGLLSSYPFALLRFAANRQKTIWVGIKVFTCGILYLIARNNDLSDADTGPAFLFFNFGILANGVMLYRVREFEETYLPFYRAAPVSLMKRFLGYALIYFIFLLPEFITIALLTPGQLPYIEAIRFALCGYSLMLLMNSITFLRDFSRKEYLIILLLIFCVEYIFLMTAGLTALYLLFFILAIVFFKAGYYKFEKHIRQ